jgi:hypothetical protein
VLLDVGKKEKCTKGDSWSSVRQHFVKEFVNASAEDCGESHTAKLSH